MKTPAAALLATLLSVNFGAAEAPVDDGKALLTNCKHTHPSAVSYCIGYIRGVVARGSLDRVYYCFPPGDLDDIRAKAVIDYLEADATQHHYPAVMLVLNALNKAFTCPKMTP